jgi:hypothetical protein
MNFETIFLNEAGRLRSGWRFAIFMISFVLTTIVVIGVAAAVLMNLPVGFTQNSLLSFVVQFSISAAVVIFFGWLYGRIFEDVPFKALGLWVTKGWFKNLVWGLIIGAGSIALAALIAFAAGGMTFRVNDSAGTAAILLTLATTLVIFILGALFEEAFLRGYALQTFARARLAVFGAVFTSLIFATMHNGNPGANPLSWLNTFLAGIWFAVAYFRARDLWLPFGLHLAWNWFQGSVFGISVSGLDWLTPAPFMKATDAGPAWLTGGAYGLEGGIACTVALILSTALIYFLPVFKPSDEMIALTSEEKPKKA